MQNDSPRPEAERAEAVGATRVGLLQPQDLVITILGAYLRRPLQTVWSGGMVDILNDFGFTTEAARAALARLVLRGLLDRRKHGRMVHYALTDRAHELLAEGDRRIFTFGRGRPNREAWTVLWHAIPEDRRVERSRLARRLRFLGFGSIQDATWVAASDRERDVLAVLHTLDVEQYASVFVGRPSRVLSGVALLDQAWDLDGLEVLYEEFLSEFAPLRRARTRGALSDREAFLARTRMLHRFREFPFQDPELPAARSPSASRRADAVATFDEVYEQLAEPADRHFGEIARVARVGGEASPAQAPRS